MNYHVIVSALGPRFFNFRRPTSLSDDRVILFIPMFLSEFFNSVSLSLVDETIVVDSYSFETIKEWIDNNVTKIDSLNFICLEEESLELTALLNEHYKLDSYYPEDVVFFRDKVKMKKELSDKILIPDFVSVNNSTVSEISSFFDKHKKVVVKPVDGAGSKNTFVIDDKSTLLKLVSELPSEWGDFEVEEFIAGDLFHVDSVFVDGKMQFSSVSKYLRPCHEFAKGKMLASYTFADCELTKKIKKFDCDVQKSLPVFDRVTHLEVFVREDGNIVFLEIACRPAGARVREAIDAAFGIDLFETSFAIQTKSYRNSRLDRRCFAGWAFLPLQAGKVLAFSWPELNSKIVDSEVRVSKGDYIKKSEDLFSRAGDITISSDDLEELVRDLNKIESFTCLEVESEN